MSEGGSSLDRNIGRSPSLSEISVDPDYHPEFSLGMRPESKQLYRADDRSLWEDWAPDNAPEDVEAGSFAQECALISPLIKRLLDGTFGGYEGVNTRLKQVTFKAPFHPFYYRWHLFEKLQLDEQDEDTKKHLDLLYPIVRNEILPHIEAMEDLVGNMVISFDLLWAIFSPGMEVYTRVDGQDRILSLRHSKYAATMEGTKFLMDCRYVDCDGSSFGYALWSLSIDTFDGIKAIVDLDVIPAHLHPNVEDLVDRLHARGQTFERLNGFHHMAYSGFYTDRSSRQTRKRHVQNSRIIIDPDSFNMYGTSGPTIDSLEPDSLVNATDSNNGSLDGIHNVIYRATSQAYQDFLKALDKCQKYRNSDLEDISLAARLSPLQRLLCAPVVRGYSLASKTWAEFYIDGVCPIRWSENAFSNLVLPHGYKDIIHAFVQEQLSRDDNFDDIIYGKGLGFIICLSGEPGVGKTLTAESVAEEMRQPLYSMSAGELGETAVEVEDSLELVLELTTKWNAILLLDECDIFLEARTSSDIRRNRLVSTFLKRLEYYRGVMFLTTNRVSSFDAAFESRIHLTIHYPSLDSTSRLHIWKTFVGIGGSGSQLTNSDLEILSRNELNGRQIKNVIKTARLLSKQKMAPLAMEHVEMVLRVKRGTFVDDI